ncbi:MAG TPA: ATP-binding protein [Chitinophagaceae bacterium]|nr:ATP-binding protein [Chitinophagaceae bacterium]
MMPRKISPHAKQSLSQFRALCITGPRQSGKTTLSRQLFKGKPYINEENPSVQYEAEVNPELFLKKYENGALFDEVQRVPHIFRYLQEILDRNKKRGQFILTGSNNFLLQEKISQSLAGRAGYLSLLPFSYAELAQAKVAVKDVNKLMLTGGYPEIWDQHLNPGIWLNSYIQTYVQRDVRLLRNITNLATFNRFIYLCANYAGQILNRDELAKQTMVDTKTILAWLGLLENSYIIYILQPWYNNMNKRIVKSPKLYFYDTGLLCYLLGIKSNFALHRHTAYGSIFENWVITEIKKNNLNTGLNDGMFYFRDNVGNEVDLITERDENPLAIEIKSASKFEISMLRNLHFWQKNQPKSNAVLLYGGRTAQTYSDTLSIAPWTEVADL